MDRSPPPRVHRPQRAIRLRSRLLVGVFFALLAASSAAQEGRVLKLGVRADAPPFSSKIGENMYDGYTVELCRLIANEAIIQRQFDQFKMIEVTALNRFQKLRDGEVDMLCGASTVTLERMRVANFTLMTFLSGASVIYNKAAVEEAGDNKNCSLTIGVLGNTTTQEKINRVVGEIQGDLGDDSPRCSVGPTVTISNHDDAIEQLLNGCINAYIADREILLALRQRARVKAAKALQPKIKELDVSPNYLTFEPYAIGINIEQRELWLLANKVLSKLFDWRKGVSGNTIATVLRRYFPRKKFSKDLEYMFRLQQIERGKRVPDLPSSVGEPNKCSANSLPQSPVNHQ